MPGKIITVKKEIQAKKGEGHQKKEINNLKDIELEDNLKYLYQSLKNKSSKKNAESIINMLASNIFNLVKKNMESNTFFILPSAEDLFFLLGKNRSKEIRKKITELRSQIFEYISFQNVLFQEDSRQASFYFIKNQS
ncbi:hypothetical protein ACFL5G_04975 [Candidatus Margulisiibacteriota bacterium]